MVNNETQKLRSNGFIDFGVFFVVFGGNKGFGREWEGFHKFRP